MEIRIYETISQEPNGDRDSNRHPCSAFDVVLVNGEMRATVFSNNQFDSFHCHIDGTRLKYYREAANFAKSLSKTIGGCEIIGPEITKTEKEIMELEARIEHDQSRLWDLKMERCLDAYH